MEHVKNEYEHQVNASEIQIKVIYSSKYFNSEYMEYVGYGKCENEYVHQVKLAEIQ